MAKPLKRIEPDVVNHPVVWELAKILASAQTDRQRAQGVVRVPPAPEMVAPMPQMTEGSGHGMSSPGRVAYLGSPPAPPGQWYPAYSGIEALIRALHMKDPVGWSYVPTETQILEKQAAQKSTKKETQ